MDAKEWACWLRFLSHSVRRAGFTDVTPQQSGRWGEQERDVLMEERALLRKVKKCEEGRCDEDDLIWFPCTTKLNKKHKSIVHEVQGGK